MQKVIQRDGKNEMHPMAAPKRQSTSLQDTTDSRNTTSLSWIPQGWKASFIYIFIHTYYVTILMGRWPPWDPGVGDVTMEQWVGGWRVWVMLGFGQKKITNFHQKFSDFHWKISDFPRKIFGISPRNLGFPRLNPPSPPMGHGSWWGRNTQRDGFQTKAT